MREHLKSIRKIRKKVFINGAGAEIRTRVPGSTVPEDDRLPYPGINKLNKKLLKCGSRDSNPGRPASTGPKPVSFGRSDTPATKRGKEIPKYLSNIKNAPTGIRTRVFGSKGRNDWPDYTTGAYLYK